MTLLEELPGFVNAHYAHRTLASDAEVPMPAGYPLTIACPCGVILMRWAAVDPGLLARLN